MNLADVTLEDLREKVKALTYAKLASLPSNKLFSYSSKWDRWDLFTREELELQYKKLNAELES